MRETEARDDEPPPRSGEREKETTSSQVEAQEGEARTRGDRVNTLQAGYIKVCETGDKKGSRPRDQPASAT